MKTHTPNIKYIINSLMNGPVIKPTGLFWEGYTHILKGNTRSCRKLLRHTYLKAEKSPKTSERLQMMTGRACGFPIKLTECGWVEILAASGQTIALADLYRAGRVDPIHAINAEIELKSDLITNCRFHPTYREMNSLLEFYDLESEILSHRYLKNDLLQAWLKKRRANAVEYFEVIESCQKMEFQERLKDEKIDAEIVF